MKIRLPTTDYRLPATLLAVVIAGCGRADAEGTAGPAGWTKMAVEDKAVVGAWAEPARGCYAAVIEVKGKAAAEEIVTELARKGAAAHDVIASETGVTLEFIRAPYQGRARATFDEGGVGARICFWNEREPAACAAACAGWLK